MDGHQFRGARIYRDMMLVSSVCRRALGCEWGGVRTGAASRRRERERERDVERRTQRGQLVGGPQARVPLYVPYADFFQYQAGPGRLADRA